MTIVEAPPYRLPTMAELRAVPSCGLSVVSTFSGCGGSCLGFESEGYSIRFASEFIDAAADTYEANHAGVPVDRRDIRSLDAADVLDAAGLDVGECDVMEGSPPCASFSASGKTSKSWGKSAAYSSTHQRTDDLFGDFARLRDGIMPRVFVAENVAGLVRGVSKGHFIEILARLRQGYRVEARMLDAQWLGVPQVRRRIIFVGVRDDVDAVPVFPKPLPYRYTLADAIGAVGTIDDQLEVDPETGEAITLDGYQTAPDYDMMPMGTTSRWHLNLKRPAPSRPCPTLLAAAWRGARTVVHPTQRRHFTIAELRRIGSFPADFVLTGTYAQRAERIGRAVPPRMMAAVAAAIRDELAT